MYLGQLLAYPIWLYIGASVITIVGSAIKNSKGQEVLLLAIFCQGGIEGITQKNNQKTQKSVDKDYKRVYNIIIKKLRKALLVDL